MNFLVTDFGAVGDGVALDTRAVQAAIDEASKRGGRVIVPPGTFRCGTIVLRSRVTLQLEQGAVIAGSTNLGDYITRIWGHHADITPWHLILAEDAENIVITGEGTIDGNGPSFWLPGRAHDWDFWKTTHNRVSPMVELVRCRQVRIENVTLRNSAGWTLHLHDCDHAQIRGLTIRNTMFGPNTDGIDLTGCHNVTVSDCDIVTGDDAIALKTSEYSRSCEQIAITNCVLQTSCVAVRLGFESRQDFRHIAVSNLAVKSASRIIDLRSVEGAVIEHCVFSNITGTTNSGWPVNRPIELCLASVPNIYKPGLPPEHHDFGKEKPLLKQGAIRDITIRDVDVVTDGRVLIAAQDGHEISDVLLDNLRLRYAMLDDPTPFGGASSTGFLPNIVESRTALAAIVAENVRNLVVDRLHIAWPKYPVPDDWYLLTCPQRLLNRGFYEGHEEAIRRGAKRVAYKAFWGRGVTNLRLDTRDLTDSEGGAPL